MDFLEKIKRSRLKTVNKTLSVTPSRSIYKSKAPTLKDMESPDVLMIIQRSQRQKAHSM